MRKRNPNTFVKVSFLNGTQSLKKDGCTKFVLFRKSGINEYIETK